MLGFLFRKPRGLVDSSATDVTANPATGRERAGAARQARDNIDRNPAGHAGTRPPQAPEMALADRLAAAAALADSDPALLTLACEPGPVEWREALLARLQQPQALAHLAMQARSPEMRFAAVQALHDETLLAEVAQQARSRDKRVFKVARERLDASARERERLAMQAHWLATAEALAAEEQPELSRMVELERVWAALRADGDADLRFQQARNILRERLQAQASARREQLRSQALAALEPAPSVALEAVAPVPDAPVPDAPVPDAPVPAAPVLDGPVPISPDAVAPALDVPAPDVPASGPAVGHAIDQESAAAALSSDALSTGALSTGAPSPANGTDAAAGGGSDRPAARGRKGRNLPTEDQAALRAALAAAVEALEQALESGHLHEAEVQLNALSALQSKAGGAAGAVGGRIRRAAEEIARLRAWRRWGGQQARDHLCEAAEALPGRGLSPDELGRSIRALRAQWQEIASREGGAPQALWERFDRACETAWEPVREHFAQQAERRAANQARREEALARIEGLVASLESGTVEWRTLTPALAELQRTWRTLGPVDRKVARSLEQRFSAAVALLDQRLTGVRAAEAAEREALIRRAEQLAEQPDGRDTVTKVRDLQTEWQNRSRGTPLARAVEQALWERFRAACDSIFSARDAQRAADQQQRAAQQQAEDVAFRTRSEAWRGLREGLAVCASAELALATAGQPLAAEQLDHLQAALAALPGATGRPGQLLQARVKILQACTDPDTLANFLALAKAAQGTIADALLDLEIGLGLASPPECQAQRRALQLRKLADSLRSGGRADLAALQNQAMGLLDQPVVIAGLATRLDAILAALAPVRPVTSPMGVRPVRPQEDGAAGERRSGARNRPDRRA